LQSAPGRQRVRLRVCAGECVVGDGGQVAGDGGTEIGGRCSGFVTAACDAGRMTRRSQDGLPNPDDAGAVHREADSLLRDMRGSVMTWA
jgi:hypothetical protein